MITLLTGAALTRAVALIPTPPPDVDPSTGKGPEWGKAAPVGLLVILLLCLATYFLMRSMNRKIKAVPASFEEPQVGVPAGSETAGSDSTGAAAAGSVTAGPDAMQAQNASTDPDAEPGAPGLVNERSR